MRKYFIITFYFIVSINCFSQTKKSTVHDDSIPKNMGFPEDHLKIIEDLEIKLNNEAVDALLDVAKTLFDLKRYEEVYLTYEKAINLNPENIKTLVNRGIFLIQYGKFELGENDLNKALEVAKNSDEKCYIYPLAGAIFGYTRNYKKSYNLLSKAHVCDPSNIDNLINLSAVSGNLEKDDEAIKYLQQAIKIDPTNYMIYGNLGFIYQEQGKYEEAILTFKKALNYKQDDPQTLGNLAFNEYKLGNLDSALFNINKSIKSYPENPYSYKTRAMILLTKGDRLEACSDIQIALDKDYTRLHGDDANLFQKKNCNN